jgi:hypothetical protein
MTVTIMAALGAAGLVLLLLLFVIVRVRRSKQARRQWSTTPPSWGGVYRDALARDITHPTRLRLNGTRGKRGRGFPLPTQPSPNKEADDAEKTTPY